MKKFSTFPEAASYYTQQVNFFLEKHKIIDTDIDRIKRHFDRSDKTLCISTQLERFEYQEHLPYNPYFYVLRTPITIVNFNNVDSLGEYGIEVKAAHHDTFFCNPSLSEITNDKPDIFQSKPGQDMTVETFDKLALAEGDTFTNYSNHIKYPYQGGKYDMDYSDIVDVIGVKEALDEFCHKCQAVSVMVKDGGKKYWAQIFTENDGKRIFWKFLKGLL